MAAASNSLNHFLSSLSHDDPKALQRHLRPRELALGAVIYDAGDVVQAIWFPYVGVVSFVVGMENGQFIEAGLIGRNSVVGAGAALDGRLALTRAVIQSAGSGATRFVNSQAVVMTCAACCWIMTTRSSRITSRRLQRRTLEERLSRWLLQVRDLIRTASLPLTQEFLAQMF
jgi:CRP-like cAMP-binding protein